MDRFPSGAIRLKRVIAVVCCPEVPPSPSAELQASLDDALRRRIQRHELGIAYFRVGVWGLGAVVDFTMWLVGQSHAPTTQAIFELFPPILFLVFALWLRRGGWRPWIPTVAACWDVVISALTYIEPTFAMQTDRFVSIVYPTIIPFAAVLVVAAGLRFRRDIVWGTALTYGALYGWIAMRMGHALPPSAHAYAAFNLFFVALGVDRLTVSVKEAVRAELGKVALGHFLQGEVVDRAFERPEQIVAEPRTTDVTVLVTDIRGFTRYAERKEPREVLRFLNLVQSALAKIVREEGGTVDKFLGDGMLAVFGAPNELPNHAARAIAATRRILRVPEDLAAELEAPIAIGAGLHSGEVVIGVLGGGHRFEFTVIGDAVNTASRLESMTKEHGVPVLVSSAVVERAGSEGLRRIGDASVRGRGAAIELWTLDADVAARAVS